MQDDSKSTLSFALPLYFLSLCFMYPYSVGFISIPAILNIRHWPDGKKYLQKTECVKARQDKGKISTQFSMICSVTKSSTHIPNTYFIAKPVSAQYAQ